MKIGFKTSQTDADWPTLLATWELACEAVGRDPGEIEISAQAFVRDRYEATLEVAAHYLREGAHHVILVMRADQGPEGLKRLAHEVAEPLREQFG